MTLSNIQHRLCSGGKGKLYHIMCHVFCCFALVPYGFQLVDWHEYTETLRLLNWRIYHRSFEASLHDVNSITMHRPGSRIGCLESKWSLYVHYTKLWSLRWVRLGWRKCFTRWWALRTEKLRPILCCFLLVPDIKLPLYSPASSLPAFHMIYIYHIPYIVGNFYTPHATNIHDI